MTINAPSVEPEVYRQRMVVALGPPVIAIEQFTPVMLTAQAFGTKQNLMCQDVERFGVCQ